MATEKWDIRGYKEGTTPGNLEVAQVLSKVSSLCITEMLQQNLEQIA